MLAWSTCRVVLAASLWMLILPGGECYNNNHNNNQERIRVAEGSWIQPKPMATSAHTHSAGATITHTKDTDTHTTAEHSSAGAPNYSSEPKGDVAYGGSAARDYNRNAASSEKVNIPRQSNGKDGGPALLKSLDGKCFEATVAQFDYTFCPYHNITQKTTKKYHKPITLGVWSGWKPDKSEMFRTMVYQNGDPCEPISQQPRSAKVEIACAKERLELVRVHESSTCEYRLLLHTPFPCSAFNKAAASGIDESAPIRPSSEQTQQGAESTSPAQMKELQLKWEQLRDEMDTLGIMLGMSRTHEHVDDQFGGLFERSFDRVLKDVKAWLEKERNAVSGGGLILSADGCEEKDLQPLRKAVSTENGKEFPEALATFLLEANGGIWCGKYLSLSAKDILELISSRIHSQYIPFAHKGDAEYLVVDCKGKGIFELNNEILGDELAGSLESFLEKVRDGMISGKFEYKNEDVGLMEINFVPAATSVVTKTDCEHDCTATNEGQDVVPASVEVQACEHDCTATIEGQDKTVPASVEVLVQD